MPTSTPARPSPTRWQCQDDDAVAANPAAYALSQYFPPWPASPSRRVSFTNRCSANIRPSDTITITQLDRRQRNLADAPDTASIWTGNRPAPPPNACAASPHHDADADRADHRREEMALASGDRLDRQKIRSERRRLRRPPPRPELLVATPPPANSTTCRPTNAPHPEHLAVGQMNEAQDAEDECVTNCNER